MYWMKRCCFYPYLSRPWPSLLQIWISRGAEFCAHPEAHERLRNGTWQCDCGYHGLHLHICFRHCSLTHSPVWGCSRPWVMPSGSSSKAWEELDTLGMTPQEPAKLELLWSNPWIKGGLGWNLNSLGHICMIQSSCFKWVGITTERDRVMRFYLLRFQTRQSRDSVMQDQTASLPEGYMQFCFSQLCCFWFWREPSHCWLQATYTVHYHLV